MKKLTLWVLMLAVAVLQGRVLTVDTDGSGDYTTITAGVNASKAGDTVLVKDGTYNERITVSKSGTAADRIVIRAENQHGVSMKGFTVQADYVTIDGFEITGISDQHAVTNGSEIKTALGRMHVHVINNYIHDISSPNKWAVHAGRYGYVAGNLFKRVQSSVFARSGSIVENNRSLDLLPAKPNVHVFFLGDSITIRGNYLWDTNNSVTADGAHFFTTWDAYHEITSHDILIENNTCFNTKHASEPTCGATGKCSRFTYRNNLFVNTYYVGIMVQSVDDVSIYNNTFINCGSYPVWFSNSGGSHVVKNNLMAYWGTPDSIRMGNPIDKHIKVAASSMPDADYNYTWRYSNEVGGSHDGAFHPALTFVNPEPFDTALADFSLKAGATVINAGCDMGITYDNDGNPRPSGGAFDIRAFEYQSTGMPLVAEPPGHGSRWQVSPVAIHGELRIMSESPLGMIHVVDAAGKTLVKADIRETVLALRLDSLRPGRYFILSGTNGSIHSFLVAE